MLAKEMIAGACAGAGAMYLLDPEVGRRRRALVRDQVVHTARVLREEARVEARDAANRAWGAVAEAGGALRGDGASDRVVAARVRSELGRCVGHPRAIEVTVVDGRVRLEGAVLAAEATRVREALAAVRGVRELDDRLAIHERPDVPSLQGAPRQGAGDGTMVPAARMLLGLLGAGAVATLTAYRPGATLGATALAALGAAVAASERARLRSIEESSRREVAGAAPR